jgi:PAS domain S-box-containing protein
LDTFAEGSRELVGQRIHKALKGEGPTPLQELQMVRCDGSIVDVETRGALIKFDEQPSVIVVVKDISARKIAEEGLKQSEERYRTLFETMTQGIVYLDPEGKIMSANPAAKQILSLKFEELEGHQAMDAMWQSIHEDGTPFLHEEHPVSLALLGGEPVQNVVMGSPNPQTGETVWIRMDAVPQFRLGEARPYQVYAVLDDITIRMEMEKELRQARDELEARVQERKAELTAILTALRESEERFRQLAENIREVFVLFTPGELQPFYVSPAYAELVGRPPESFYEDPNSFLDAIYPEDRPEVGTLQDMINQGKFDQQYRMLRPDGSLRWVRARGFPVRNKQGELYRVAAIIEDVTPEVEAYQILEQRVEERTRELSSLLSYTEKLASTLELKSIMQIMLDQLCSVVDYDGAAVLLLEGDELVAIEYQGSTPEEEILDIRFPPSISYGLSQVLETLSTVIFPDIQNESEEARQFRLGDIPLQDAMLGKARSWLGAPLIVKNQLLGILRLSHSQPDRFNQRHAQLVTAIANQAAMAIENAQLYDKSRQLAALGERQRLARELHDSVSQALYGISLGTHTAIALARRDPEKLDDVLKYVLSLAEAGLTEMRALIFELRPDSLETDGLIGALSRAAAATQARRGVTVKTNLCDEVQMPIEVKEALYRISQEAMQNAIKHANPSEICLDLSCSGNVVEMLISDDGRGFDTSQSFPGHLGLRSMSERATRLGGTMVIDSAPGKGTRVKVKLPI